VGDEIAQAGLITQDYRKPSRIHRWLFVEVGETVV
jgi:hypothetical protein